MNLLFLLLFGLTVCCHAEDSNVIFVSSRTLDDFRELPNQELQFFIQGENFTYWVLPKESTWNEHRGDCLKPIFSIHNHERIEWEFFKCVGL